MRLEVAHHLAEHVPLDLGEGQAQMLVRQVHVLAPAGLVEGPIHHPFRRLRELALGDLEIVHASLQSPLRPASKTRSSDGTPENAGKLRR